MLRKGFGQVEPTHLEARRAGNIYAQLSSPDEGMNQLENGQFVKYDYVNKQLSFDAGVDGEWLLVYNEAKNYYPQDGGMKDFCLKKGDMVNEKITSRNLFTKVNDLYITNCLITGNTDKNATVDMGTIAVGDTFAPEDGTGFLKAGSSGGMVWKVVELTHLPDGQPAVKLQRIH